MTSPNRSSGRCSTSYQSPPTPLFAPGTVDEPLAPNRLRWDPPADLPAGGDFVDGMVTMLANRHPRDLARQLSSEPACRLAVRLAGRPLGRRKLGELEPRMPVQQADERLADGAR